MQHPNLAQKIARALSEKFTKKADVILALTPSDSVLAQEVARVRGVRAIFASKDENGEMILKHNFSIKPGENVLIVDDVAVSGRKINRAIDLVNRCQGEVIGVGVLVDRSMGYLPLTVPLRALLSYPMQTFSPAQCPLCAAKIPFSEVEELKR